MKHLGGATDDTTAITLLLVTRTTSVSLASLNVTTNVTSDATTSIGAHANLFVPSPTSDLRRYGLKFSGPPRVACGKPNGEKRFRLECSTCRSVNNFAVVASTGVCI
ncbi:hypothetical protein KPH14_001948 [Odynerus spinipes]|uniref:Uncharacterized protein n=1 Tax=Odynerus spinipes TaxID=1348599 RepID=A0AAD9S0U5_9HYME|nr:hypothetical protein KPH14_001948 [Odynerus spinipes]